MNVEEYLRLSNMTRNSELELMSLYNKKQKILEMQSLRAKQAVLEMDRMVLVLRQEVSDLKIRIGEQETMYNETRERNDALRKENNELREMLNGSQGKVLEDHKELEREINVLRKENKRLEGQITKLQQERNEIERRCKDLSVENARITQQNTCLLAKNSTLLYENEQINKDLHAKDAKTVQYIEEAKSELLRRNRELECSNKELGASLLNLQLQYNDLLVKNAEIIKNACTAEKISKQVAVDVGDKCSNGVENAAGNKQMTVQREDVVAILRELLQQNEIDGASRLAEKINRETLSSKNTEECVVDDTNYKNTTKEKGTESKLAISGLTRRGPGRPPSKRSAPQPEKALQKIPQSSAKSDSSSLEEKDNSRSATVSAENVVGSVASSIQAKGAKGTSSAGIKHMVLNEMPLKKKARAGISAYSALTKKNEVRDLGDSSAKNTGDAAEDSGLPTKEITKIENESFFANLTFSSSSPFFKK